MSRSSCRTADSLAFPSAVLLATVTAVSAADLERLVDIVLRSDDLQARLLAIPDRAGFVRLVTSLAAERGLSVSDEDVTAGLRAARRSWQERWI